MSTDLSLSNPFNAYYNGVLEIGNTIYLNYDLTTTISAGDYYRIIDEVIFTVNSSGVITNII